MLDVQCNNKILSAMPDLEVAGPALPALPTGAGVGRLLVAGGQAHTLVLTHRGLAGIEESQMEDRVCPHPVARVEHVAVLATESPGGAATLAIPGALGVVTTRPVFTRPVDQALVDIALAGDPAEASAGAVTVKPVLLVNTATTVATGLACTLVRLRLTLQPLVAGSALAMEVKPGEVGGTGAAVLTLHIQLDTEVSLLLTVDAFIAVGAVAAVLLRPVSPRLFYAGPTVDAWLLPARLHLELLAVLALVLGQAGAGVVPGLGGLTAGAVVPTGLGLALVQVLVTQPPRPAGLAAAGVVIHSVLTLTMHAGRCRGKALVYVDLAQGAAKACWAGALKLLAWLVALALVLALLLVAQDAFTHSQLRLLLQNKLLACGGVNLQEG